MSLWFDCHSELFVILSEAKRNEESNIHILLYPSLSLRKTSPLSFWVKRSRTKNLIFAFYYILRLCLRKTSPLSFWVERSGTKNLIFAFYYILRLCLRKTDLFIILSEAKQNEESNIHILLYPSALPQEDKSSVILNGVKNLISTFYYILHFAQEAPFKYSGSFCYAHIMNKRK